MTDFLTYQHQQLYLCEKALAYVKALTASNRAGSDAEQKTCDRDLEHSINDLTYAAVHYETAYKNLNKGSQ